MKIKNPPNPIKEMGDLFCRKYILNSPMIGDYIRIIIPINILPNIKSTNKPLMEIILC